MRKGAAAQGENTELIVVTTRGRTGLDRLIFGSVAEKVVCPNPHHPSIKKPLPELSLG